MCSYIAHLDVGGLTDDPAVIGIPTGLFRNLQLVCQRMR
jgi:hypothetical protein